MGFDGIKTIAAAMVATIVVSALMLTSCKGRKMSNMEPVGETVEVVMGESGADTVPAETDSLSDTSGPEPLSHSSE